MAELSFGHNLRAKRKEVVTNTLSFLPWAQGCLTACGPTGGKGLEGPAEGSVKFKGAPNKMLGITLHEYGSAQMLKVQMVNLPAELQDNELLIKVKAAGVNPMDCKLRSGSLQQLYPLTLPVILGCEWSGTVVKAGRCAKYKPGDQVFGRQTLDRLRHTSGAYAQYMVADSAECCSKPSALSHIQAASVPWAGLTAYGAVVRAGGLREEVAGEGAGGLLVLGASGGVGSYAVQLARHALGSRLVVGTSSAPNAPFLHALGAHTVVSYTDEACWSLLSRAAQQAPGGGFAVVLDCVGGDDYWEHGQGLLRGGGVYVTLVGGKRYGAEADNKGVISVAGAVSDQVRTSVRAGLGLLGAQHKYTLFTPSMTNSADLKVLAALLQKRTIIPVVKQVVSMYEAADAHRVLDAHHAVGKTVLQVGKKGEDDEDTSEEGSAEEEEEEEEGAAGSEPDEDDDMAGLKAQQEAVAARIKASLASHTPPHAPPRPPAGLLDIDPDLDPEEVAWVERSGAAQLMRHLHRQGQPKPAGAARKEAAGGGGKKGREEGGGAEGGGGGGAHTHTPSSHTHTPSSHTHTADPPKSVSFAGPSLLLLPSALSVLSGGPWRVLS